MQVGLACNGLLESGVVFAAAVAAVVGVADAIADADADADAFAAVAVVGVALAYLLSLPSCCGDKYGGQMWLLWPVGHWMNTS